MSTMEQRRSRRATVPVVVLGVAAAGAVLAAVLSVGTGDDTAKTTAATRTETVSQGVIQSTVSGSGSLEAQRDRELAFAYSGTVKKVFVSAGAAVHKHQVLARMTSTDGATHRLRAPFAGRVASVNIAAGDTVGGASSSSSSSSSTPTLGGLTGASSDSDTTTALELVSLKGYDLTVSLSESDIGKVKQGQTATVSVDATGDKLAARVRRVSLLPTSSSSSSSSSSAVSYAVTLRLSQTSDDIKPGMSASADIVTSETNGLVVPTAALRGNTVTVVDGSRHVTTQVQTGAVGDDTTQITSGLHAGDKVLVTSASAQAGANAGSGSTSTTGQQSGRFGGFGGAGGFPGGGPPGGAGGFPGGGPPGLGG